MTGAGGAEEVLTLANRDPEISAGATAFRAYLDQVRQLCPELSNDQLVHAAAQLAHAETLALLLGLTFRPPVKVDPRLLRPL